MTKKVLSIFLVLAMLVTLFPLSALADDGIEIVTTGFSETWTSSHSDITITAKDTGAGISSMTVNGVAVSGGNTTGIENGGTPFYKVKQLSYDESTKVLTVGVFLGNVTASAGQVAFKYDTSKMDAYHLRSKTIMTENTKNRISTYYTAYNLDAFEDYGLTYDESELTKAISLVTTRIPGQAYLDVTNGVGYITWNVQDREGVVSTSMEMPLLKFSFKLKDSVALSDLDAQSITLPAFGELTDPSETGIASPSYADVADKAAQHTTYKTTDGTLKQVFVVNGKSYCDGAEEGGGFTYSGSTRDAVNGNFEVVVTDKSGVEHRTTIPTMVDEVTSISAPTYYIEGVKGNIEVRDFKIAETPASGVTYLVELLDDDATAVIDSKTAKAGDSVSFNAADKVYYRIRVTATTGMGVTNTSVATRVIIYENDNNQPNLTVVGGGDEWTNQDVTLTITATDAESGIKSVYIDNEKLTDFVEGTPYTYVVSDEGEHHYDVKVLDFNDNGAAWAVTVKIDKTAPTLSVSADNTLAAQQREISISAEDALSGIKSLTVNGEDITGKTTYTATANGDYKFVATDYAGNTTEKTVPVSNIDNDKPILTIRGVPTVWTNRSTSISISTDKTCDIYVDGNNIAERANSVIYLVDENKTFVVRVVDEAGNETTETVVVDKIDKTAPVLSDLTRITDWAKEGEITFKATDDLSGIKEVTCGGTEVSLADGVYKIPVTQNGTYTIVITDNAGNSTTEDVIVDKIDFTPPTLTVLASNLTAQVKRVLFNVTAFDEEGGSGIRSVTMNGEDITDRTNNITVTENGDYLFVATDNAGNQTTYSVSVTNIDNEAPTLTVKRNPEEGTWTNFRVYLAINASETCTFYVNDTQIDADTESARHQIEENGTYVIRAVDKAGNETTETIEIGNIDKVDPTITVTGVPTSPCKEAVLTIETNDELSGIKEVKLSKPNGDVEYLAAGTDTYTVTENGLYAVIATDNAGNMKIWERNIDQIDNDAPVITSDYPSAPTWVNHDVDIAITIDKACDVTVTKDGTEILSQTGTTQFTLTADENAEYVVTATDEAGNVGTRTISVTNIDKTAPEATVSVANTWARENVITVDASDAESGIESVTIGSLTVAEEDGVYTAVATENTDYPIVIKDKAGNEITDTAHVAFVDRDNPTIAVSADNLTDPAQQVTLTFNASDATSDVASIVVNGVDVTGQSTYAVEANGTYMFTVTDLAGNTTTSDPIVVENIDRTAPVITIEGNPQDWTNSDASIVIKTNEISDIYIDSTLAVSGTTEVGRAFFVNGTYEIRAVDRAGNESVIDLVINRIDKVNPVLSDLTTVTEWTKTGEITFKATDADSGIKEVTCSGTAVSATDGVYKIPVAQNGTYTIVITDNAGNSITRDVVIDKIDLTAPTLSAVADNSQVAKTRDIIITYSDAESGMASVTVNGAAFTGVSGTAYVATANGEYTVVATDNVGNTNTVVVTVSNVDNTAPVFNGEIAITETTETSVTVSLPTATDDTAVTYALYLNDAQQTYDGAATFRFENLTQGTVYTVKLVATDAAGNTTEITKQIATAGLGGISVQLDKRSIASTATVLKMKATVNGTAKDFAADGTVLFENLPAGTYKLKIEGAGYMTYEMDVTVAEQQITTVSISTSSQFIAGEIVQDGVVDIFDLNAVASMFQNAYTDSRFEKFDLNRDGSVNADDITVLVRNLGNRQR